MALTYPTYNLYVLLKRTQLRYTISWAYKINRVLECMIHIEQVLGEGRSLIHVRQGHDIQVGLCMLHSETYVTYEMEVLHELHYTHTNKSIESIWKWFTHQLFLMCIPCLLGKGKTCSPSETLPLANH